MGDTDETRKSRVEMENLSLDNSRFSRNLLQRFMESSSSGGSEKFELEEEDEGEVELNLGLSLGGRFGVDKNPMKLKRSSSVAACLPMVRDDDPLTAPAPASYPALVRTSSLPAGTEEEWRKRKELQSLRRLEAKRRRSEKQRNLRGAKEAGTGGSIAGGGSAGGGGGCFGVEDVNREIKMNLSGKRYGLSVSPPGIPTLAAGARQAFGGSGIDLTMGKGKGSFSGSKVQGHVQTLSQGSIESQGGGGGGSSSSMSELESKTSKGSGELSAASIQSLQEGVSQDVGSSGSKTRDIGSRTSGGETESTSKAFDSKNCQEREKTRGKASGDMPCVFTKGDGPNGRRIDGILYKYGKGEEVRIMCVCHGDFLSPADFVKHAGGSDVAHPLKHIVINPNASPLM